MTRAQRLTFLGIAVVIAVVAVILLAGGGDETDKASNPAQTPTPTATATATASDGEATATPTGVVAGPLPRLVEAESWCFGARSVVLRGRQRWAGWRCWGCRAAGYLAPPSAKDWP